jgi:hypothetical protein
MFTQLTLQLGWLAHAHPNSCKLEVADKTQILCSGVMIRCSLAYDVDPLDLKLNPSKGRKVYSRYVIPRTSRSIYKRVNTS